jgi:hypothetical protein
MHINIDHRSIHRCETCGGIEMDEACICLMDGYITALEEDNSRLRQENEMLTTLVDKLLAEIDDADLTDLLSRIANEQRRRQRQRQVAEDRRDREALNDLPF